MTYYKKNIRCPETLGKNVLKDKKRKLQHFIVSLLVNFLTVSNSHGVIKAHEFFFLISVLLKDTFSINVNSKKHRFLIIAEV